MCTIRVHTRALSRYQSTVPMKTPRKLRKKSALRRKALLCEGDEFHSAFTSWNASKCACAIALLQVTAKGREWYENTAMQSKCDWILQASSPADVRRSEFSSAFASVMIFVKLQTCNTVNWLGCQISWPRYCLQFLKLCERNGSPKYLRLKPGRPSSSQKVWSGLYTV